jgi:hypothetical protein
MDNGESVFSEDEKLSRRATVDFAFRPLAFYSPNLLGHDLGDIHPHLRNL